MHEEKTISLIRLLDDPDPEIILAVEQAILELGLEAIPHLEKAWETSMSEEIHTRIENLIHRIQFNHLKDELTGWLARENPDLLEGVVLIARHQYPDLRVDDLMQKLQQIRFDLWIELNEEQTALEKVRILNHVLFDVYKFSGNTANYYSPQNSCINQVLETRKGNPILLAVVYLTVGQMAGLPLYGVNLPLNFVTGYADSPRVVPPDPHLPILFYINPFSRGNLFSRAEIDFFLEEHKIAPRSEFFQPCPNQVIVRRILSNLIVSYEKLGYLDKAREMNDLLTLFPQEEA